MRTATVHWSVLAGVCLALVAGCDNGSTAADCKMNGCGNGEMCSSDGRCVSVLDVDGGTDGDVGTDGGAELEPYTLERFDNDVAQALCDLEARCGQFSATPTCTTAVGAMIALQEMRSHGYSGAVAFSVPSVALQRAVSDGRVHFDSAAAAACVAEVRAHNCSGVIPPVTGPCTEVVVGAVKAAQPCYGDFECAPGGYCDPAGTCPGLCKPQKGQGEATTDDGQCMAGLYFDFNGGTCVPVVPVDEPCPNSTGGGIGFGDRPRCTSDAYCDEATDICRVRGDLGADCQSDAQCMSLFACIGGKCSHLTPKGGACDLIVNTCQHDLQCTAVDYGSQGTCADPGKVGDACYRTDQCQAGLLCVGATAGVPATAGTCAAPLAEGQACDANGPFDTCASTAYCSHQTNTCQPRIAIGAPCTELNSCAADSACANGTCTSVVCEDPTP